MPVALTLVGGCKADGGAGGEGARLAFAATLPRGSGGLMPLGSTSPAALAAPGPAAPAEGPAPRCPTEMAELGAFCIDRYEAHLVTVEADGRKAAWPHQKRPEPGQRYQAASEAGAMPQGFVSRIEAAAACQASGKRLCSSAEWLTACEGAGGRVFPYGNALKKGACNSGKPHLMQKLFGRDARSYTYDLHYNSPRLALEPGFLAGAGEYEGCVSPEGVHDLVGNLHEWVSDPVDASFRKMLIARKAEYKVLETAKEGNAAFFGGFYSTTDQLGAGCGYITAAHAPDYHDYSTGFRCCQDAPEPPVTPR